MASYANSHAKSCKRLHGSQKEILKQSRSLETIFRSTFGTRLSLNWGTIAFLLHDVCHEFSHICPEIDDYYQGVTRMNALAPVNYRKGIKGRGVYRLKRIQV